MFVCHVDTAAFIRTVYILNNSKGLFIMYFFPLFHDVWGLLLFDCFSIDVQGAKKKEKVA
jgi:hypothetical protein